MKPINTQIAKPTLGVQLNSMVNLISAFSENPFESSKGVEAWLQAQRISLI